jgi:Protein of unknown function (DUF3551)
MRSLILLPALGAIALAGALQNPTPVHAAAPIYQWCMQPAAQRGPDCYYSTLEQCRATAFAVGFCYENPFYTVARQGKTERRR